MNPQHSPDWKGCPPRVRSIVIIDDCEVARRQFRALIEKDFPKLEVRTYKSIFETYQNFRTFDYMIIDVSSVAPMMMSDVQNAWAPIAKFMEHYQGTDIIIHSAMARSGTHEVIEDVQKATDRPERVHYGGIGTWEPMRAKLHELIKPEDMEWTKVKSKRNK